MKSPDREVKRKEAKGNYAELRKLAQNIGACLFGVADVNLIRDEFLLPSSLVKHLHRGICLAAPVSGEVLDDIQDRPTPLYYHHYRQLNFFLDRMALKVSLFLQRQSWRALPIPASQIIDWEKQKGHLSHKKIAEKAGLGWIGRNNLLINPKFGARIRLVTILTNMPLLADEPIQTDCGKCRECISSCPAQAIKESLEEFDHLGCFEQLRLFQKKGYAAQHICGICVKACPGKTG
jgi:epoxyqueuosine reductase QueG